MFRKLHPEKSGWSLRLLNVAATNMVESAGEQKQSSGRDIGKMFRKQGAVLKDWKPPESDPVRSQLDVQAPHDPPSEVSSETVAHMPPSHQNFVEAQPASSTLCDSARDDGIWEENESDDEVTIFSDTCKLCGASIPQFAMAAHELYHTAPD